jgi:hypothetical protein
MTKYGVLAVWMALAAVAFTVPVKAEVENLL